MKFYNFATGNGGAIVAGAIVAGAIVACLAAGGIACSETQKRVNAAAAEIKVVPPMKVVITRGVRLEFLPICIDRVEYLVGTNTIFPHLRQQGAPYDCDY